MQKEVSLKYLKKNIDTVVFSIIFSDKDKNILFIRYLTENSLNGSIITSKSTNDTKLINAIFDLLGSKERSDVISFFSFLEKFCLFGLNQPNGNVKIDLSSISVGKTVKEDDSFIIFVNVAVPDEIKDSLIKNEAVDNVISITFKERYKVEEVYRRGGLDKMSSFAIDSLELFKVSPNKKTVNLLN